MCIGRLLGPEGAPLKVQLHFPVLSEASCYSIKSDLKLPGTFLTSLSRDMNNFERPEELR